MSSGKNKRERRDLDRALVLLDIIGVMLRAASLARNQACAALMAPFDPFWPEGRRGGQTSRPQTSMTMPSRANSHSSGFAPGSRLS
jgi:hypothetical protein